MPLAEELILEIAKSATALANGAAFDGLGRSLIPADQPIVALVVLFPGFA